MKSLDPTRPITAVQYDYPDQDYTTDHVARHMDIIGVNKYSAWYTDPGHTELITRQIVSSLRRWREAHGKPLMVTEYGADTMSGLHALPSLQFTEDFQCNFEEEYFKVGWPKFLNTKGRFLYFLCKNSQHLRDNNNLVL